MCIRRLGDAWSASLRIRNVHEDIVVLDAKLAEATKANMFKKAFPERHLDVGIAENNMVSMAAGLATCGKVPFISSFAMFLAGRAYEQIGPVYMRFGRFATPVFNDAQNYEFKIGKGIVLKEGTDVTIFATGLCVKETIEAEKLLAADAISAEIINIHTIKPIDRELIVKSVRKTGKAVTVEEHSVIGGLGSAVCEVLAEEAPVKVLRIGVQDVFGKSGTAEALIREYGLDAESVWERVKEFVFE